MKTYLWFEASTPSNLRGIEVKIKKPAAQRVFFISLRKKLTVKKYMLDRLIAL
jgi:hypothetical protein